MKNLTLEEIIENNLIHILGELKEQPEIGKFFSPDQLSYDDWICQLEEWVMDVCEWGVAYESIVCTLEQYPFMLSGKASIKLVETALLMEFKTTRIEDAKYDLRRS